MKLLRLLLLVSPLVIVFGCNDASTSNNTNKALISGITIRYADKTYGLSVDTNDWKTDGMLSVEAAYPNPSDSLMSIVFTIPKDSQFNVDLHDSADTFITSIANAGFHPGIYTYTFDFVKLGCTPGIYRIHYTLRPNGSATEVYRSYGDILYQK